MVLRYSEPGAMLSSVSIYRKQAPATKCEPTRASISLLMDTTAEDWDMRDHSLLVTNDPLSHSPCFNTDTKIVTKSVSRSIRSRISSIEQSLHKSCTASPKKDFTRNSCHMDDIQSTKLRRCVSVPPLSNFSNRFSFNNTPLSIKDAEKLNPKCKLNTSVATVFGTGTVVQHRTTDNTYKVQLASNCIAYLQSHQILREVKAIVGERVQTRWGTATVEQYYDEGDMYGIRLDWRWDDKHIWRMKATKSNFEKIPKSAIGQTLQIMKSTKRYLVNGYSQYKEGSYANQMYTKAKQQAALEASHSQIASDSETELDSEKRALTAFGICIVNTFRHEDQIFVAEMPFGGTAYLQKEAVKLQRNLPFPLNEKVKTHFGVGRIDHFCDTNAIYKVNIESLHAILYVHEDNVRDLLTITRSSTNSTAPKQILTNRLSSLLSITKSSVASASAMVKASASLSSSMKAKVSAVATSTISNLTSRNVKFAIGERVLAKPFGSGFIQSYRPSDRVYTVLLRRTNFIGYYHESSLSSFPYGKVTHLIVDGKSVLIPEIKNNDTESQRRAIVTAAIRTVKEQQKCDRFTNSRMSEHVMVA